MDTTERAYKAELHRPGPAAQMARLLGKVENDDDPLSTRSLTRKGFDSDGTTITYKATPMWPADVLTDPEAKGWRDQQAVLLSDSYERAFAEWLRLSLKLGDEARGMQALPPVARELMGAGAGLKGLGTARDTLGGFLVPTQYTGEIISRRAERSVFRRRATIVPTVRDRVRLGRFIENGSVYSSAFTGGWVGETQQHSDTEPIVGSLDITVHKARATARLNRDLADDAPELLGALIADAGANLAVLEDASFIDGDGVLQPVGLLSGGASTVDVEGTTSNTISNTTTNAGSADKLLALAYSVPSQYARNSVWLTKHATHGKIRRLVDFDGRRYFPRDATDTIEGWPVEVSDGMPADGADAAKCIVFGDLSAYYIADRAALSVSLLRERYADQDQFGLMIVSRVGGALANADAIRVGVV